MSCFTIFVKISKEEIMVDIRRTKVKDLLTTEGQGQSVTLKGWVRTKRGNKHIAFIALNDGSTINNIQVVADIAKFEEKLMSDITTGACIKVIGKLIFLRNSHECIFVN